MNIKMIITLSILIASVYHSIIFADTPTPQVLINTKIVETDRSFVRELGVNWNLTQPIGDFGAFADMGFGIGVTAGVGLTDQVQVELGIDYNRVNTTFGDLSVNLLAVNPAINIYLKSLEDEQAGNIISSPKITIGTSFETAISTTEISFNNTKWRAANSGFGIIGGAEIPFLETGNNVVSVGAKGRLALTNDSEDYIKMFIKIFNKKQRRGASTGGIDQPSGLSYGAGLTFVQPTGDFASAGGPGVGVVAKIHKPLTDLFGISAGGSYASHIKTGSLEGNQGNSLSTINGFIGATLKLNVTPVISPIGEIRMDVTVANFKYNDISTSETSGTLLTGLAVREMITDNVGISLFHGIPLIGKLFSDNETNSAKTELVIFLTPQIIKGHE